MDKCKQAIHCRLAREKARNAKTGGAWFGLFAAVWPHLHGLIVGKQRPVLVRDLNNRVGQVVVCCGC